MYTEITHFHAVYALLSMPLKIFSSNFINRCMAMRARTSSGLADIWFKMADWRPSLFQLVHCFLAHLVRRTSGLLHSLCVRRPSVVRPSVVVDGIVLGEIFIMGSASQAKFGLRMYPHRAHLYQKNWVDRFQDGRLAAILNAEIPLFDIYLARNLRNHIRRV